MTSSCSSMSWILTRKTWIAEGIEDIWNHLEAFLPIILVPGIGWLKSWVQLGVSTRTATYGLSMWLELPECSGWFPRGSITRGSIWRMNIPNDPGRSCMALYNLAMEVIEHHFFHILLVKYNPASIQGEGTKTAALKEKNINLICRPFLSFTTCTLAMKSLYSS